MGGGGGGGGGCMRSGVFMNKERGSSIRANGLRFNSFLHFHVVHQRRTISSWRNRFHYQTRRERLLFRHLYHRRRG